MYKNVNDYELLYLISENDECAYNDIYTKYKEIAKIEAKKAYKKCKYLGISVDDLYQVGQLGLTKAITNYKESEGILFYTCASVYINKEIQTFIRDKQRHKHNILSDSISLDKELDMDGTTLFEIYSCDEDVQNNYDSYLKCKKILDFKYYFPSFYSQIYELRLNGFTNQEIATLLDVKYKKIDNALIKIKNLLKKNLNNIELY